MNDYDRFLESELHHMLDHIVATRAPKRGRRNRRGRPSLVVLTSEPAPLVFHAVEPIAVPVVALLVS